MTRRSSRSSVPSRRRGRRSKSANASGPCLKIERRFESVSSSKSARATKTHLNLGALERGEVLLRVHDETRGRFLKSLRIRLSIIRRETNRRRRQSSSSPPARGVVRPPWLGEGEPAWKSDRNFRDRDRFIKCMCKQLNTKSKNGKGSEREEKTATNTYRIHLLLLGVRLTARGLRLGPIGTTSVGLTAPTRRRRRARFTPGRGAARRVRVRRQRLVHGGHGVNLREERFSVQTREKRQRKRETHTSSVVSSPSSPSSSSSIAVKRSALAFIRETAPREIRRVTNRQTTRD